MTEAGASLGRAPGLEPRVGWPRAGIFWGAERAAGAGGGKAPAGFLVASLAITDKERFVAEYASKVAATLEPHGGKYVLKAFAPDLKCVEGPVLTLQVVLEFPSLEKAVAWHDSPEYQAIMPARLATTDTEKSTVYITEGL